MIGFSVYNKYSGEILWSGYVSRRSDLSSQVQSEDQSLIEVYCDNKNHYVDVFQEAPQVKSKLNNPTYLEDNVLKSVPNPSLVSIYNSGVSSLEVTDGEVVLEADLPDTYKVIVNPADSKYYSAEFEVNL